jgi:hypothetical protein
MQTIDALTAAWIGAISAALVNLVGIIINNFFQSWMNRLNIKAKRSEISLTKRLEALINIAASLGRVEESSIETGRARALAQTDVINAATKKLDENISALKEEYHKNSIYIPKKVDKEFNEKIMYILSQSYVRSNDELGRPSFQFSPSDLNKYEEYCQQLLDLLRNEIQSYIDA